MNEAEWLTCTDPLEMIEFLRGNPKGEDKVSWWKNRWQTEDIPAGNDRRFRLFACHCCRRIWDRIPETCNRDAVAAVESWLEGDTSGVALSQALTSSSSVEYKEDGSRRTEPGYWVVKYLGRGFYKMTAAASAIIVASQVLFMSDNEYGREAKRVFDGCFYEGNGVFLSQFFWPQPVAVAVLDECALQTTLLRDIFGNPFRRVNTFELSWLTSTVLALTNGIYNDKAFNRMPILADALQDAGCDHEDILNHCRGPGPHVRGCWVIDLLTGRK